MESLSGTTIEACTASRISGIRPFASDSWTDDTEVSVVNVRTATTARASNNAPTQGLRDKQNHVR